MMRQSLIALSVVSALAYSGLASATLGAGSNNVSAGATAQSTPITYATRATITAVGFDANVVENQDILVDASVAFQVTTGAGTFVACDGNSRVQNDFNTEITCSAAGVYTIRTLDNTAVPNLNGSMRVLYNVEAAAPAAGTANVTFGPYCTGTQAPATDGCTSFFLASTARDDAPTAPTSTSGTITVQSAAPPALTFAPASGTILSGSSFTITPSGGQAGGSATYTCTGAGVNFTNGVGSINQGGAAATVTPTCAASGSDLPISCTHTGGAGSTASPVAYTVDCPAAPAPVLASTPANGTTLSCNGAPGNVVNTQATIQNTGNADMTGVSCSVSGAGFALQTAPTGTIAAGGSSNAVVACTVPATGTATGTLSCTTTAPAGGALSFPLSSSGQTVPVFVEPDIIPTNSLWSKLGLVGLLAVLGLVAVGFRRQQ